MLSSASRELQRRTGATFTAHAVAAIATASTTSWHGRHFASMHRRHTPSMTTATVTASAPAVAPKPALSTWSPSVSSARTFSTLLGCWASPTSTLAASSVARSSPSRFHRRAAFATATASDAATLAASPAARAVLAQLTTMAESVESLVYSEYERLCAGAEGGGLNVVDAYSLAREWDRTGQLLLLETHSTVSDDADHHHAAVRPSQTIAQSCCDSTEMSPIYRLLYLRPAAAVRQMHSVVDPCGKWVSDKREEAAAVTAELATLNATRDDIERRAETYAKTKMAAAITFTGTQVGILAYLTFVQLSWDIMEPVTYFVGAYGGLFTLAYVAATRREHSAESWYHTNRRQRRQHLMTAENFPLERHAELTARQTHLAYDLKAYATRDEVPHAYL